MIDWLTDAHRGVWVMHKYSKLLFRLRYMGLELMVIIIEELRKDNDSNLTGLAAEKIQQIRVYGYGYDYGYV